MPKKTQVQTQACIYTVLLPTRVRANIRHGRRWCSGPGNQQSQLRATGAVGTHRIQASVSPGGQQGFPEEGDGQVRAGVSEHPQAHQLGKVGASRSLSASCQKLSGSEPNVMEAMTPECFLACMILSEPRASPKTRSCSQQSRPGAYRSASSSS